MIQRIFGWGKQRGTMRKTKHRGTTRAATGFPLSPIAYNLIRLHEIGCRLGDDVSTARKPASTCRKSRPIDRRGATPSGQMCLQLRNVERPHPHLKGNYPEQSKVGRGIRLFAFVRTVPPAQSPWVHVFIAAQVFAQQLIDLRPQILRQPAAVRAANPSLLLRSRTDSGIRPCTASLKANLLQPRCTFRWSGRASPYSTSR
jgi:hypothetical protein